MNAVTVNASRSYNICIENGLLARCGFYTKECIGGQKAILVSDDQVAPLYADAAANSLSSAGYRVERYVISHGEAFKNAVEYIKLLEFLAAAHLTRTDVLLALGGGVVGDLTGFAAATYLRGIPFVQIPTSLLAMVDSSVGGKTAIDLQGGKNLAGAFYQPYLVLCDPEVLRTLPQEYYHDGCAEIVKYGMIADNTLFCELERDGMHQESKIIETCISIKRDIVQKDEHDTGIRQILNFGHTVGHAIEKESHFSISHGHAVAMGMAEVTRASVSAGLCHATCMKRLEVLLQKLSLPACSPFSMEDLSAAMLSDKKRNGDHISLIVPREIGRCEAYTIPVNQVTAFLLAGKL